VLPITGILSEEQVREVRSRLATIAYVDGMATIIAPGDKDNRQASLDDPAAQRTSEYVRQILASNFQIEIYARPARWSQLRFAQYGDQQHYGRHLDDWKQLSLNGELMRRDISFTIFLSEPDSYDGGELVIERLEGPLSVKMPAGSIFLYSTGLVHEVKPVTRGERHVCIGWIQSRIRHEEQRHLLYELSLAEANMAPGEPHLLVQRAGFTLLRMWSDM
jgi:PKHD-type hydroxylase